MIDHTDKKKQTHQHSMLGKYAIPMSQDYKVSSGQRNPQALQQHSKECQSCDPGNCNFCGAGPWLVSATMVRSSLIGIINIYVYILIFWEICAFMPLLVCSLWCVQKIIWYIKAWRSCLFVCLHITLTTSLSLSSLCRFIGGHWHLNDCHVYYVQCLPKIKSIFSIIFIQYMEMAVFSLPISLVVIVRLCVFHFIIIPKSEVWTIRHNLGLVPETIICAVDLAILLSQSSHRIIIIIVVVIAAVVPPLSPS